MFAEQFEFRSVPDSVTAKTCHGSIGSRPGDAFVEQIGKDRFVKRHRVIVRVLIKVNAHFFCGASGYHDSSPSAKILAMTSDDRAGLHCQIIENDTRHDI
jgi:hypothetical protein